MKRTVCPASSAWCARFCASVLVPTPLGPTKITFVPSRTKRSVNSFSTNVRSSFFDDESLNFHWSPISAWSTVELSRGSHVGR